MSTTTHHNTAHDCACVSCLGSNLVLLGARSKLAPAEWWWVVIFLWEQPTSVADQSWAFSVISIMIVVWVFCLLGGCRPGIASFGCLLFWVRYGYSLFGLDHHHHHRLL